MPIICSRREMASRGVLAWIVVIEPSWPVFMACSMSKASSPRHSPRMMRSGRMRSAFLTRSRWRISPLPSMLGGRVSMRPTCGCCSCSSAASSMVIRRSFSEMKADSALSIVVLPEPVPPEMIVVMRAFTAAASTSAICGRSAPMSTSLFRLNGFLENLRIETSGPSTAIGPDRDVDARAVEQARVAQRMRFIDPAADRRDDLVDDAQQMRLVLEAHAGRLEHAAALDVDAFVAVDQDVVDGRVLEQRLERPEPGHLVEDFGDEVVELLRVEREPLDQDVLRRRAAGCAARISSSGSFSSAERLISSISRRCRRTLASSSLSLSSGLDGAAAARSGSGAASGNTVHDTAVERGDGSSATGTSSGRGDCDGR